MADLPKSVRARLAAQQTAGGHPDADLLSAFAEGALLERERQGVITHLAACGQCREVVAIITPAEGPPLPATAPRRSWLSAPLLRWATVSVAAVVVIAVVVLYHSQTRPVMRSDTELAAPVTQAPAERVTEPAAKAGERHVSAEAAPVAPKREQEHPAARRADAAVPQARAPEPAVKLAPVPGPGAKEMAQDKAVPPPPVTVAKSAAAPLAGNVAVTAAATPAPSSLQAAKTAGMAEATAERQSMMKPKVAAPAPEAYGVLRKRALEPAIVRQATSWSISPEGKVERTSAGIVQAAAIDEDVVFHAVAAVGMDVWAGGSGGALFHSGDAGQSWKRVPSPVTEDIVALEFSNSREGRLRTASGREYVTHDGGKSWLPADQG